ncbi:hypothetical protein [Spelaeicoccus albus]|uniref:Uncharacterized protein n=1 Tax=Spelaeicoccus albus TaxID=1280376 RepID=A0A7Z0D2Z6_9MICO|nr:hypothetical protein [Spelaeicoccus albus]NYI67929.1 hypothetical protein [Spelaeicoccus albus]
MTASLTRRYFLKAATAALAARRSFGESCFRDETVGDDFGDEFGAVDSADEARESLPSSEGPDSALECAGAGGSAGAVSPLHAVVHSANAVTATAAAARIAPAMCQTLATAGRQKYRILPICG